MVGYFPGSSADGLAAAAALEPEGSAARGAPVVVVWPLQPTTAAASKPVSSTGFGSRTIASLGSSSTGRAGQVWQIFHPSSSLRGKLTERVPSASLDEVIDAVAVSPLTVTDVMLTWVRPDSERPFLT